MNPFDWWSDKSVLVTGGAGFLGQAVLRELRARGAERIFVPRSKDYDLTSEVGATRVFHDARPDIVLHLAAEVGGIGANCANPGRYFYANMAMGLHLIEEARQQGLERFIQVGTICAYPKHTPVPFREDDLWIGYPEETNAPYGIAKKALMVMLQAYRDQYGLQSRYLLPVNLYGPGDDFDTESSHVIPALIRKFVGAAERGESEVEVWGTGSATREFLYVDDCARGIVTAAELDTGPEPINLGTGREITIRALAQKIGELCGFDGRITWDESKPDGQPRRCLDTSRAEHLLDFRAEIDFDEGLRRTIDWWRKNRSDALVGKSSTTI